MSLPAEGSSPLPLAYCHRQLSSVGVGQAGLFLPTVPKKIRPDSHQGGCDRLLEAELTVVPSRPHKNLPGCLLESGEALTDVLPSSAWLCGAPWAPPAALPWAPALGPLAGARRPLCTLRPQVQCLKQSGFSTPGKPAPPCCL